MKLSKITPKVHKIIYKLIETGVSFETELIFGLEHGDNNITVNKYNKRIEILWYTTNKKGVYNFKHYEIDNEELYNTLYSINVINAKLKEYETQRKNLLIK